MSTPTRLWSRQIDGEQRSRRKSSVGQASTGIAEEQGDFAGSGEWSCYEAGPFGFGLHRQLETLGVRNLVVCPQSWEELSTGVKTDKSDARALCVRLGLYAAGNRRIFSVVHIPTAEQERARAESRLRRAGAPDTSAHRSPGGRSLLNAGLSRPDAVGGSRRTGCN